MRNHELSRRHFLIRAGAIGAGATLWPSADNLAASHLNKQGIARETIMPIVDTHQHLWDIETFDIPWLDGNEQLNKNFLLPEYREATDDLNIVKTVYMEVGMARHEQTREAEFVLEICRDTSNNTVGAVIAGQPYERGFRDYVDRFSEHPEIKGLRHLLIGDTARGTCRGKDYLDGVRYLGSKGWCFDICIRPGELDDGVFLVEQCPDTRFVLDHCGNADPVAFATEDRRWRAPQHDADQWKRSIENYSKLDNVVCKISGIVARVNPDGWSAADLEPIVKHCCDCFGEDRIIFASDWPVCTMGSSLAGWVEALFDTVSHWPTESRLKLFAKNAERFYGI